LLRMLPSKLVATTSYNPACSAAMLRISSTTFPGVSSKQQLTDNTLQGNVSGH
jgi:hypothetical protein